MPSPHSRNKQLLNQRDAVEYALRLQRQGLTNTEIAARSDTPWSNHRSVSRAVAVYLRNRPSPEIEQVRDELIASNEENRRGAFDELRALYDSDNSYSAVTIARLAPPLRQAITAANAEIAKLAGAYAPAKSQVEITEEATLNDDIEGVLAELARQQLDIYKPPPGFRLVPIVPGEIEPPGGPVARAG